MHPDYPEKSERVVLPQIELCPAGTLQSARFSLRRELRDDPADALDTYPPFLTRPVDNVYSISPQTLHTRRREVAFAPSRRLSAVTPPRRDLPVAVVKR